MRLILTTLFIAILVVLAVILFGPKPQSNLNHLTTKPLSDYSKTDAQVRLTTDGHLNGEDQHMQIRITIDAHDRTLDIIQGYNGHVVKSKTQTNNQTAYDTFLRALDLAGFTRSKNVRIKDERGFCPEGSTFIYQLINTDKHDTRLWSSDCGGGTFAGKSTLVQDLFINQITGYEELTNQIQL